MYKTKVEVDVKVDGIKITWGEKTWGIYTEFKKPLSELHTIKEMCGYEEMKEEKVAPPETTLLSIFDDIKVVPYPVKEIFQHFTNTMGCTPSTALKTLNKLMYKVWIAPIGRDVVWALCRTSPRFRDKTHISATVLNVMHLRMDKIIPCLQDNQKHLIPICVAMNKTPKELKDSVSRAVWKQVVNNSLTRNGFIGRNILDTGYKLEELLPLSSSLFKFELVNYPRSPSDKTKLAPVITNAIAKEGKFLTKYNNVRYVYIIIKDALEMADKLNVPINPKWKWARWKEEHNKFAKEITARKYSDEIYSHIFMNKLKHFISNSGYTARLLNNSKAVALEGLEMVHCVANYAEWCSEGGYAVYSITDPEGVRSTLGIRIHHTGEMSFNQHYTKYDNDVNDRTAYFGNYVVNTLRGIACRSVEDYIKSRQPQPYSIQHVLGVNNYGI